MITKWQTLEEFKQSPTKGWCWITYLDSYNGKTGSKAGLICTQAYLIIF